MGVCNRLAGDMAGKGVDAAEKLGAGGAGGGDAFVSNETYPLLGGVVECLGGGAGVGGGHVCDAVVDDAFFLVGGILVGGGAGGFGAAALIDGDVHKDAAGLHDAEHFSGDEFGGFCTGDEDGADEEVDAGEQLGEICFV